MSQNPGHKILERYLGATPGEQEASLLETLLVDVVRPLLNRVVKRRFFGSRATSASDQEDVCGDAMAAITARVRAMREGQDTPEIDDFEAFAAGVAARSASRFFMARTPRRSLLRNRLRYLLTTDDAFRISQTHQGEWHCGLAGKALAAVLSDAEAEACRRTLAATRLPVKLPELVQRVLTIAGGALELSALTSLVADALGLADRVESLEDSAATLRSAEPAADRQAEKRQLARQLWHEVSGLPLPQRRALLLNLGSAGANGQQATAWLIPDLGIATFRELADTLGMTPEALAAIWNDIPLPDNEIAALFGLERQQVINLRSAARERLARRMPI